MQVLRASINSTTVPLMDITDWLTRVTDSQTPAEISDKTGISKRTIQHQISTGRMSIENLVRIGAAYGHHPIETLIEWGVIDAVWRTVPNLRAALKLAPEQWLSEEVLERMLRGVETAAFTTPVDELATRRATTHQRSPLGIEEGVADGSPDHPEEDTDFD